MSSQSFEQTTHTAHGDESSSHSHSFTSSLPHHLPQPKVNRQRVPVGMLVLTSAGTTLVLCHGIQRQGPWGKQGPAVRQSQGMAIGLLQPLRASLQAVNAWCSFSSFWACWSANGNILSVLPEDGGGCLQARTKPFNPGTGCFCCLCFNQGEDLFTNASPSPSVPLLQLKKKSHKADKSLSLLWRYAQQDQLQRQVLGACCWKSY